MNAAEDARIRDFCNGARETRKRRVPGRTSEVTVNAVLSPNAAERTNAAAPLTVEWADGYSGCAGVPALKKSSHEHYSSLF
jgi:hypothetical protein